MESLKVTSSKRRKQGTVVEFRAYAGMTGRNRGMSHPPIKRDIKNSSATIGASMESFKQHMPPSIRTKIVGLGRHTSDENSQRDGRTISFANKDYNEDMLFNMGTPGLRPAEISIDERHEDMGHLMIPELKKEG